MFQRTLRSAYCALGRSYPLRRTARVSQNGLVANLHDAGTGSNHYKKLPSLPVQHIETIVLTS